MVGQPGPPFRYRSADPVADIAKWRPSIFMPRWASRITLEITEIRVERLQEMSEADAQAEGFMPWTHRTEGKISARQQFVELWNKINGKTHPWESNPWVWVMSFAKV